MTVDIERKMMIYKKILITFDWLVLIFTVLSIGFLLGWALSDFNTFYLKGFIISFTILVATIVSCIVVSRAIVRMLIEEGRARELFDLFGFDLD